MLKPLVALAALVGAFYVSVSYEYGDPGWQLEFKTRPASAQDEPARADYNLASMQVLNRAVIHIKENYVDPSRINERKMIGGAMEEVQRSVPELLVDLERDKDGIPQKIVVTVDDARQEFSLAEVDNPWQMCFKFQEIFKFVQAKLKHFEKFQEIEYAAINGMLATLDPHSSLMRPEDYREMKLSTRGKFGGLGIVIAVKEGHLNIVNPIDGTPASKAGLKAGDKIVQIDQDSTVNLALQDAVEMLRGAANTKVDLYVVRDGWKAPRKFTLMRADIRIDSVDHLMLADRVGVIRIKNFQNTTDDELAEALDDLKKQGHGLKGLVLDLRSNPGGLLDQAIKVADRFIESGPIVTTVGYGDKLREPKMAVKAGTVDPYPLVILVNSQSASASEIVAGALKNHKRAVVVGTQTFGKGSVQVIYDNKDDSALKLTIAQYLTPGDISIQSVGIVPDIATVPVVISDDDTDFFRFEDYKGGEKELPEHLDHESSEISKHITSDVTMRYLEDPVLEKRIDENPNDLIVDFDISFAHDLVVATDKGQRDAAMIDVKSVVEKVAAAEREKIVAALAAKGIDWTVAPPQSGKPAAEVTVTTSAPNNLVTAGEELQITATVKNTGTGLLRQLRAMSHSENDLFEAQEFIFGNIPPGQTRTWQDKIKVPRSGLSRKDVVKLDFKELDGHAPPETAFRLSVQPLPRPRFALAYSLDDRQGGNGDGLLQSGEEVELVVDVQNVGEGKSFTTLVTLNNPEDDETRPIFIKRGRLNIDNMAPGERKQARFSFKVKDKLFKPEVQVSLAISDSDIREMTSEKFTLPVVDDAEALKLGKVKLVPKKGGEVPLLGMHAADAPPVSLASGVVMADARLGDWYRVPTGDRLYTWLAADNVDERPDATGKTELKPAPLQGPPIITLADRPAADAIQGETLTVSGEALGGRLIQDLLIFVNNKKVTNKKVFFKSNGDDADKARLRFSARVPLEAGINRITVVAREDEELSSRQTLFVHREN